MLVDFLDCCGGGLFVAAEKAVDLVPPGILVLVKAVKVLLYQ
jgi:hypothetical protein